MRKTFVGVCRSVLATTAIFASTFGECRAAMPQTFRPGTELFVDDAMVAKSENVTRSYHAATKLPEPVIQGDKPWDNSKTYIYGTVIRDAQSGKFRMWYSGGGMAYAESDDGLHWTKPELNFVERDGKPTNLLFDHANLCFVLYDTAEADASKRFKALDNLGHQGFQGFYSADGLTWKQYEKKPLITFGSEISNGVRDPKTGQYMLYFRPYLPRPEPKQASEKRLVAVITSDDFVNWSEPKIIIEPDATDDTWVKLPNQRTEFYGMSGFPYGNQYLGLLPVFKIVHTFTKEELAPQQSRQDGHIEGQLVSSRDGLTWTRSTPRTPVIPNGPYAYDAGCIMNVSSTPVIVGDEVWYYYTGLSTTHGGVAPAKRPTIALAKWRLDGFASLDAGEKEGVVETKAIEGGSKLEVNVDASTGKMTVEVLDAEGKLMPGYSASHCRVITTDNVHHVVQWDDKVELPAGSALRLRFSLSNASLYSYTVSPATK